MKNKSINFIIISTDTFNNGCFLPEFWTISCYSSEHITLVTLICLNHILPPETCGSDAAEKQGREKNSFGDEHTYAKNSAPVGKNENSDEIKLQA